MIQTFPFRTSYPLAIREKLSRMMRMAFPTIYQPGQGVYDLNQTLDFKMSRSTEEAVPWYLADGGSIANVLAAHQSLGATNLAASYDDIAHAATTWDCAPGIAPTFDPATGWYFNDTKYLLVGSGAIAVSIPLTLVVLFNADDANSQQTLLGVHKTASPINAFFLAGMGSIAGDPIASYAVSTSGYNSKTTSGFSPGVWYVATAVFTSPILRASYINGISKGININDVTPINLDITVIGAQAAYNIFGSFLKGYIAADACYNVAKSDAEVLVLSNAMLALVA